MQQAPSEWERFFIAKTAKANVFVKNLRKAPFHMPSEAELVKVANIIVSLKTGFGRLLSLLQAVGEDHDPIQESVLQLAGLALRQNGILGPPANENEATCLDQGKEWLARRSRKRLSTLQKEVLLTFSLLGWRKELLDERDLLELLQIAFLPPSPRKSHTVRAQEGSASPMEMLLRVSNGRANVGGLLELTSAWRRRVKEIEKNRALAQREKGEAEAARNQLARSVETLQREIENLQSIQAERERRIRSLERYNSDLRTEFQHSLDETRGRLKGVLEGELSRWLENAFEAVTADPPRTKVIQERLETAIARIRAEVEWLRTSG